MNPSAMRHLLNEFICTCTGEVRRHSDGTLAAFYGAGFFLFLLLVLIDAHV